VDQLCLWDEVVDRASYRTPVLGEPDLRDEAQKCTGLRHDE
jgi:hypothetical protein